jgi:hypothetical protein
MKKIVLYSLALMTLFLSGCATTGLYNTANLTNVELSEPNYTIVARSVSGTAESDYILGFSAAFGGEMQSFAVFRLGGPDFLYQAALENLWENYENQTNSEVVGRGLALVNVRYDSEATNILGFYTKAKVAITADVVEFED